MTRIAVDLLGEGLPVGPLLEALPAALDADPRLVLILVSPAEGVREELARLGIAPGERVLLRPATRTVTGGPAAFRDVRARRDAGVRVAARLVREGHADAMVSVAPVESVVASAQFTHGLLPGATRAVLAAVIGRRDAGVVLCDAGSTVGVTADELAQFALLASGYAALRFMVNAPRIGLLVPREALSDPLRRIADELLRSLELNYVGPCTIEDLLAGPEPAGQEGAATGRSPAVGPSRRLEVAVTDGYTGDVVLSTIRGVSSWERRDAAGRLNAGLDPAWGTLEDPDVRGGTIVLGVDGVAVHAERTRGGSVDAGAGGLLAALKVASSAVRGDLIPRTRAALATLVARRRALAGLAG
ncbi:phosphate starvation-inducible protein PhoH [Candidatus Frankia alpina]|uniref:phosphate acyltransferase n=1 Tax=Candidatus Frankia alpina TaxID=2699483 RepID=A0A4S5EV01_9ACTN|nr:phosphate starvation-inducible protein PhoH [Candidatus Frankia alpina]THJ76378.1 phosphate starvation-inducible protein PhoH [Candidatus Frankia alpina]